jgi:hypothetical protein
MNNFDNRLQFKFYKSYFDIALEIEDLKERANYLMAICDYQFTGVEPELTGMAKFAFLSQKHSLDKQVKGYNDAIISLNKTNPQIQPPNTTPQGGVIPIPSIQPPDTIINNKYKTTTITENQQNTTNLTSVDFVQNNLTKSTVSVNDNVNVITIKEDAVVDEYPDIDFGSLKTPSQLNTEFKNEYKENSIQSMAPIVTLETFLNDCWNDKKWLETIYQTYNLNESKMKMALKDFDNSCNGLKKPPQTMNRWQGHFWNWVRKKIQIDNQ